MPADILLNAGEILFISRSFISTNISYIITKIGPLLISFKFNNLYYNKNNTLSKKLP